MHPRFVVTHAELTYNPEFYQDIYAIYVKDTLHPDRLPSILLFTYDLCSLAYSEEKRQPLSFRDLEDKLNACQSISMKIFYELSKFERDYGSEKEFAQCCLAGVIDIALGNNYQEQTGLPIAHTLRDSPFRPIPETPKPKAILYNTIIAPDGSSRQVPIEVELETMSQREKHLDQIHQPAPPADQEDIVQQQPIYNDLHSMLPHAPPMMSWVSSPITDAEKRQRQLERDHLLNINLPRVPTSYPTRSSPAHSRDNSITGLRLSFDTQKTIAGLQIDKKKLQDRVLNHALVDHALKFFDDKFKKEKE